jgi:CRP-like cAMP-binding protein
VIEGGKSDKLYIIKEGNCVMYKKMEIKDNLGMPKIKQEKIMTIEQGALFGEDALIFDRPNNYTLKATTPITVLSIKYEDIKRDFKRLIPGLQSFFQNRNNFILDRFLQIKNARTFEL